jgi:hypothetical protein
MSSIVKHSLLFATICLIALIVVPSIAQSTQTEYFCLEYKNTQCVKCPLRTHLYQNECYLDVPGCIEYMNGTQCTKCNTTISFFDNTNKICVMLNQSNIFV